MAVRTGFPERLLYVPPILAFVLSVVYLLQIRGLPFVEYLVANPLVYDGQAKQILSATPPSQPFFLSPLYPSFVAAVYFLSGTSRFAVQLCQGILLAVNVWLVGAISKTLFSRPVALAASLGMALYWSFYYFVGEILPTTLCITFLLAGILLFIRRDEARRSPVGTLSLAGALVLFLVYAIPFMAHAGSVLRGTALRAPATAYYATIVFFLVFAIGTAIVRKYGNLMASGAILGVSALVWSGTVLVIALLALRLLVARTRTYGRAAIFIAGVLIPIAASLSHNYLISGEIIPVTSSFGVNLFIGNNAATDGMDPFRFGEGDRVRIEADRLALGGAARSAFFREHAVEFITKNPGRWLTLIGRKLLISIGRYEVDNNADISERRSAWRHLFLPVIHFGIVFPLAMVGVLYVIRRSRAASVLILGYVGLLLIAPVFFACERFRAPAVVLLLPLAAYGCAGLIADLRRKNPCGIVVPLAVLVAAGLASNIDFLDISHREFPSITVNKAYVERLAGNTEEARKLSLAALQADPGNAGAHYQLGAIEEAEGNPEAAAVQYLDSLERDPFFYASYTAAARILEGARISVSYLDAYVDAVIAGRDYTTARRRLIDFLSRRLS